MNTLATVTLTTSTPVPSSSPESKFLYIKDLPDAGGLRAGRMIELRKWIDAALIYSAVHRSDPAVRVVITYDAFETLYAYQVLQSERTARPNAPQAIEIYDLTQPIEPQLSEPRAKHW